MTGPTETCPGCARGRLRPEVPGFPERYACPRCGATGVRRAEGAPVVWSRGGDRLAAWMRKQDGARQMRDAGAGPLPGLGL